MPLELFPVFGRDSLTENRSVKPGGWVEFQDWDAYPLSGDGSLDDTGFKRFYDEVIGAFEDAGYEARPGAKLEQWFKEAGFVNTWRSLSFPTVSGRRIAILSVSPTFVLLTALIINDPVLTSRTEETRRLEPGPARSGWLRGRSYGRSDAVQAVDEGGSHSSCQPGPRRRPEAQRSSDVLLVSIPVACKQHYHSI